LEQKPDNNLRFRRNGTCSTTIREGDCDSEESDEAESQLDKKDSESEKTEFNVNDDVNEIMSNNVNEDVNDEKNVGEEVSTEFLMDPIHDPQRKAALSQAGPVDHVGFVSLAPNPEFDLKNTIFGNLPGFVAPAFMKTKIGNIQYWQEKRLKAIEDAYQKNVQEEGGKQGENE
jgi:hypothetical protein